MRKAWVKMMLLSLALSLFPAAGSQAAPTDPWKLVWYDEFNLPNGSAPDSSKWSYDIGTGFDGGWGNNEKQYYTDSRKNSYHENGHLVIKALKESVGGREYTSARLVTKNKGDWKYGRFVIKAKLPTGSPGQLQGIWPAIWMLPTDYAYGNWPQSGEIDIMEMVGKEASGDRHQVWGSLHFGNPWKYINAGTTVTQNDFHEYAVEWEPDQIRWYVDNQLIQTRYASEWYSSGGPHPAPFDQRFHLLMNLAVGGNWPGNPDAGTVLPQSMLVDYVRVYTKSENPSGQNLLSNPGFESGISSWSEWHGAGLAQNVEAGGHTGTKQLAHWHANAYRQFTYQPLQVPNGTYKASVWLKSGGGQNELRLVARNHGGPEMQANVGPGGVPNWTRYVIDNIQVTAGYIEIGVWSDALPNTWAVFDDFELVKK